MVVKESVVKTVCRAKATVPIRNRLKKAVGHPCAVVYDKRCADHRALTRRRRKNHKSQSLNSRMRAMTIQPMMISPSHQKKKVLWITMTVRKSTLLRLDENVHVNLHRPVGSQGDQEM